MTGTDAAPRRIEVRVYWEDTDAGGIVYHASYLRFMERARTELLRGLGVDQVRMQAESGITFVVRRLELDYHRPARMDDLLTVETDMAGIGAASLALVQRVCRAGTLLVEAKVTCVAVARGRPARIPAELRARLAPGDR